MRAIQDSYIPDYEGEDRPLAERFYALLTSELGTLRKNGKTLNEARVKAMNAGTLIHEAIEAWLNGTEPPEIPEEHAPAVLNGFEAFKKWFMSTRLEPISTELNFVHPTLNYGGTLDYLGKDADGMLTILDWKSGSGSAVYPSQLLQARGYGELVEACTGEKVEFYGIHKFDRDNGNFFPHTYSAASLAPCWVAFEHCLELYELRKSIKKMV
jgi:hypothetical protein